MDQPSRFPLYAEYSAAHARTPRVLLRHSERAESHQRQIRHDPDVGRRIVRHARTRELPGHRNREWNPQGRLQLPPWRGRPQCSQWRREYRLSLADAIWSALLVLIAREFDLELIKLERVGVGDRGRGIRLVSIEHLLDEF